MRLAVCKLDCVQIWCGLTTDTSLLAIVLARSSFGSGYVGCGWLDLFIYHHPEPSTILIWTASTDKKYMELNGASLKVRLPHVTPRKTPLMIILWWLETWNLCIIFTFSFKVGLNFHKVSTRIFFLQSAAKFFSKFI